jgi:hypothetical protein
MSQVPGAPVRMVLARLVKVLGCGVYLLSGLPQCLAQVRGSVLPDV